MNTDHPASTVEQGAATDGENPIFWEPSLAYVRLASTILLTGALVFMLVIRIAVPEQTTRYLGPLLAALVATSTWVLLWRGQHQAAVYLLAVGAWVVITGIAAFFGGVRSVIVYAYPVTIILIGWLIGSRAAVAVSGLTVATLIGFVLGDSAGALPVQPPTSAVMFGVVQILIVTLATVLIVFLVRAYKHRHSELSQLSNMLALRTADLHRAQAVAQMGSWTYDLHTDTMHLSAETCRIFGVPDGTSGSRATYLAGVHAEDCSAVDDAWQAALTGAAFDHEHRIVVRGATRWVRQSAEITFSSEGTPRRAVGIVQDTTARKHGEAALLESEMRYRMLLDWMPDAVAVHRDGRLVYANPAAVTMLGAPSAQDLIGRRIIDSVHPDYRARVLERIRRASELGVTLPLVEEKFITLDGASIDVEVQGTAILYDGAPAIHVAMRDITARKQTEKALRVSDEMFAKAFQASPLLISITTQADGRYIDVNDAFLRLLGHARQDVIGRTSGDIQIWKSPHDRQRVIDALTTAHGAAGTEVELRKKSGEGVVCEVRGAPINIDGTPCLILVTQDITERRLAQSALQESETRYRTLAEWSPEPITVHRDGTIVYVNPASVRMMGATDAQQLVGHTVFSFIHSDSREVARARAKEVIDSGRNESAVLLKLVKFDGSLIAVESQGVKIMFDGQPAVHSSQRDVTERNAAEATRASLESQLRESQKMEAIGTLAGGIAHDFNNIIATILGNAELAHHDAGANEPLLESLDEIRTAGMRARDLVQQILSFSRREPTTRRVLNLAPVVEESGRLLRATLPARVALELYCDPTVPAVLADKTQIEQVLINLATNAMQAMLDSPGRIDIRVDSVPLDRALEDAYPALHDLLARHPGRAVRLTVSDNGPGMDAAMLERIFEPFFTSKQVGEGTGLGLSVVHGIVQAHEGAIVVKSELGQGTTFTVYLPLANVPDGAQPQDQSAAPSSGAAPMSTGHQILYIDDEAALVLLVKRVLERRGIRVIAHTSQQAALDALRADPAAFDLVLTDYNMPEMSGLDVAREVRRIHAGLPVAVVSGFIDETLRANAAGAGVRELIFKANSVEELCRAIETLLPAKH